MAQYVLKGAKRQGERVGKIEVDADRTLVLDGDPVELSEDEHKALSQSYKLRKVGESDEGNTSEGDGGDGDTDGNEGGETPSVKLTGAKPAIGDKSAPKGGDK